MKKCLTGLFVIAFFLGLPGGAFIGLPTIAAQDVFHSLSKPMPVPDFSLENLQGKKVDILGYQGKVLLLNFWATWCTGCRKEAPSLEKLYSQFRAKDFILFRINSKESQKTIEEFLKDHPNQVPILLDKDGRAGRLFGVWVHPSTYLVDRRGNVRYRALGAVDWMGVEALSVITKLLEEEIG